MDLIERQAAIDAIDETNWYHQNENKDMVSGANSAEHQPWFKSDDVYSALKSVPSAPRWIPVTERLPDTMDSVLVTDHVYWVDIAFYDGMKWWYRDPDMDEASVSAWMPLPEPYKE